MLQFNKVGNGESCLFHMKWKSCSYHHPELGKKKVKRVLQNLKEKEKDPPGEVCKNYELKNLEETVKSMENTSENILVRHMKDEVIDAVLKVVIEDILGLLDEVAKVNNKVNNQIDAAEKQVKDDLIINLK